MSTIAPAVRAAILPKRGVPKPQRVALAAALCPEILSEKKKWTRNPGSLVEAEVFAQQCGRSMQDIKLALVEWVMANSVFGTIQGLAEWDAMLGAWCGADLAERVVAYTAPYEASVQNAINHIRRVVKRGVPDESNPRNVSLILEGDMQRRISDLYAEMDYAPTEKDGRRMRRTAVALMVASSALGVLTSDRPSMAAATSTQLARAAYRIWTWPVTTGEDSDAMTEKQAEDEIKRVVSNAIMSYPLHYTGGSGALAASSAIPAVAVGVLLGAAGAHLALKR